jgi:hypothetical protein
MSWTHYYICVLQVLFFRGSIIYIYIYIFKVYTVGQDSNWLWAGWSGSRIPLEASLSAPVQTDPGAHPASYTLGTGSFPGGAGRSVDHLAPSRVEATERVELYIYYPSGPSWPFLG